MKSSTALCGETSFILLPKPRSQPYTGINKHEGEDIGGWDTVIKKNEYEQLFYNQQATMETPQFFEIPVEEIVTKIDEPVKDKQTTIDNRPIPIIPKVTPLVSAQYGIKQVSINIPEKKEDFVAPNVKVGDIVNHKKFGDGTISKLDKAQRKIYVSFKEGEKVFVFPDSFKQGFLKV